MYKDPHNQRGVNMSHSPIYCASYIQYIHGACHFTTYESTPTVHSYFTTVTQPNWATFYAFTTGTIADGVASTARGSAHAPHVSNYSTAKPETYTSTTTKGNGNRP